MNTDWRTCAHRFSPYFGTLLKCQDCGATTTTSAAPGESKPIDPPADYEAEPTPRCDRTADMFGGGA